MNTYTYDELNIGDACCFEVIISSDMMEKFCQISGDINPLHCNKEFAEGKGFSDKVVYGMLVASMYSRLTGVYLPGKDCLLHSVYTDFCKPVFIGDKLSVSGTIIKKNDIFRQIIIKAVVINQNNEKVSRAKIEAGVI